MLTPHRVNPRGIFLSVAVMKRVRVRISLTLVHVTLLLVSFTLAFILNPYSREGTLREFDPGLSLSILLWLGISSLSRKLEAGRFRALRRHYLHVVLINLLIGGSCSLILFVFQSPLYSVFIVFVTIMGATLLEIVLASFLFSVKHAKMVKEGVPGNAVITPVMKSYIGVQQSPVG